MIGIRQEIKKKEEIMEMEEGGLIEENIKVGSGTWQIIGIYINRDIDKYLKRIEE